MRRFVRFSLIGLIALVGIGFAFNQWVQTDAPSDLNKKVPTVSEGLCESDGVSLLVSFGKASSLTDVSKCVTNYIGTSWDLFYAAGMEVSGTSKYPVGFVCRIQDFPNEEQEECRDTSNVSVGSWAYFIAQPGEDSWKYSIWGAATHQVACGSAEAWVFKYPNDDLESPPAEQPVTRVCSD
jgi:hypothetical protein